MIERGGDDLSETSTQQKSEIQMLRKKKEDGGMFDKMIELGFIKL